MTKQLPLFTVIVAVLNNAKTLQHCIDSVANQTYPQKELIIIDGGSSDGTVEILKTNGDKIAYWESKRDRGIYHAWNKALKYATGEWVCFLGADDYLWSSDVLERMAPKVSAALPEVRVVYGRTAFVNEQGKVLEMRGKPWQQVRRRFLYEGGWCVPHPGLFHHQSLFSHGNFDETFRIGGDYEFLLRELKHRDAYFAGDIVVAGVGRGGVSARPEHNLTAFHETTAAQQKNGLSPVSLRWRWNYTKACVRLLLMRFVGEKRTALLADLYRLLTGRPPIWTK
jgi:glycosyltransferase involved in cell wall biosynthesis